MQAGRVKASKAKGSRRAVNRAAHSRRAANRVQGSRQAASKVQVSRRAASRASRSKMVNKRVNLRLMPPNKPHSRRRNRLRVSQHLTPLNRRLSSQLRRRHSKLQIKPHKRRLNKLRHVHPNLSGRLIGLETANGFKQRAVVSKQARLISCATGRVRRHNNNFMSRAYAPPKPRHASHKGIQIRVNVVMPLTV